MTITLTWNDFKHLNPYQGTQILFVKDAQDGVTKCAVNCKLRLGIVFVLINPPSRADFLDIYPGALRVNDLV